jgi:hypothetical protein
MVRVLVEHAMAFAFYATVLAACSPVPSAQPGGVTLPAALSEITGAWDILSFDGYRPARLDSDGQRHAFVDVRGDGISFAIECNYSGMRAGIENGRLVALSNEDVQTEMGCGPEREGRDAAFFAFLRTRPAIVARTEGAIALENDGVRLELERPEVRRRPLLPTRVSELDGGWRADIIYWRSEPGRTDNLLAELNGAPARFNIALGQIRLSYDCETVSAAVELTAPGDLQVNQSAVQRSRSGACSIPEATRNRVASLLASRLRAENIPPNGLYLEAGDVYAVLRRD